MIPFKFGKLRDALRRTFCVALAALISLNLTLPAFAASGQLQTVGWAETVSSFLMSCGIYPYDTDENGNFTEWSAQSLTALWDEFQEDVTGVAYDIVDITASLAKGVIAIASGRWSVLREFATWIVNKYSVTDNQTGVELGRMERAGFLQIPVLADTQAALTASVINARGVSLGDDWNYRFHKCATVSDLPPAYLFRIPHPNVSTSAGQYLMFAIADRQSKYFSTENGGNEVLPNDISYSSYGLYVYQGYARADSGFDSAIPLYASVEAAKAVWNRGETLSGITADTTAVSVPDALPEGTQFGGLTVQGAGEGVTLEQLQELIREAVQDALKPAVNVVPVVVAPNVDVDANGEISTDLDINPSTVPMTASDYSVPNITGVFPFSIPWDVIAILSALNAEPVRPDFQVSIYVPVLDIHVPFHIGVNAQDAQAVDSAFAVWRNMLLVLMCVGTLLLFAKLLL